MYDNSIRLSVRETLNFSNFVIEAVKGDRQPENIDNLVRLEYSDDHEMDMIMTDEFEQLAVIDRGNKRIIMDYGHLGEGDEDWYDFLEDIKSIIGCTLELHFPDWTVVR